MMMMMMIMIREVKE